MILCSSFERLFPRLFIKTKIVTMNMSYTCSWKNWNIRPTLSSIVVFKSHKMTGKNNSSWMINRMDFVVNFSPLTSKFILFIIYILKVRVIEPTEEKAKIIKRVE